MVDSLVKFALLCQSDSHGVSKAEFRRSQKTAFALTSFGAVRLAFAQRRRLRRVSSLQQVAEYSGEGE